MKKIFIDPGHGGKDPGASGNGLNEKDITLDLALELAKRLRGCNCEVRLSRDKDTYVALGTRAHDAHAWDADLFFSIHVNAHTGSAANGYEDFTYPVVGATTANIRKELHPHIAKVWTDAGRANRGMKTANFQVLRETTMPAVLVELGFISNPQDASLLKQPAFRDKLVGAMAAGIAEAMGLQKEAGTPIMGPPQATIGQAQAWAKSRGAHQRFIGIAPAYWNYGQKTGIRPEVAYAQAAKETAFGRYGGAVDPAQNNWCGVKTATAAGDRPQDHESLPTPEDGVRAHFNHLAAYVGIPPIGKTHGRYNVVKSLSWAGTIRTVEELGARWAPAGNYGESIVQDYLAGLLATEAPVEEPGSAELERLREELADARQDVDILRAKLEQIKEIASG